jgi:hypothetical protein
LGKDIKKTAQKFVANMSFLGIASIHGQGKKFARQLRNELKSQGLPTNGKLFVLQRSLGQIFGV